MAKWCGQGASGPSTSETRAGPTPRQRATECPRPLFIAAGSMSTPSEKKLPWLTSTWPKILPRFDPRLGCVTAVWLEPHEKVLGISPQHGRSATVHAPNEGRACP